MRAGLATLAALGGLLAAGGWPAPVSPRAAGDSYPCQSRACGCVSAAKCWAGDCCCFTLEQKVAWADARGVAVPGHVRPLVAARAAPAAKPECALCANPKPAPRWVLPALRAKCRGEGPGGHFEAVELCAETPARPVFAARAPAFAPPGDAEVPSALHFPPTRPPRRA